MKVFSDDAIKVIENALNRADPESEEDSIAITAALGTLKESQAGYVIGKINRDDVAYILENGDHASAVAKRIANSLTDKEMERLAFKIEQEIFDFTNDDIIEVVNDFIDDLDTEQGSSTAGSSDRNDDVFVVQTPKKTVLMD